MATQASDVTSGGGAGGSRQLYVKLALIGVPVVLALVFIFQNTASVGLKFLWIDFRAQLWIMLLIVFVIGVLSGLFVSWRRSRRRVHQ